MMNWKGFGKKGPLPNLRHYPGICQEELREITKNYEDIWSNGRDLNPEPPEYEVGLLTTRP
jgi:hypothetical protein